MVTNEKTAPGMRRIDDPRDVQIFSFELEKEDVMRFKPIYEAMHQFLMEEGYGHPQSPEVPDMVEDLYWERWILSGAKEQHIWWRVKKDVSKYVRFFLIVNIQTLNVTKAEVAYKGKKVSGEKIDLIIRVWGYLQWDRDDRFQNSIAERFKKTFFTKIYQKEYDQKKDDFLRFAGKFNRLIKGYFEMVSEGATPVIFQPPMGYKEPS
jgi:hypothetical protein